MGDKTTDMHALDAVIAEASASGGSELANYQLFVIGLCDALGMDRPRMAQEGNDLNDYVFERRVDFKHPDGSRTVGRIDCYRRNFEAYNDKLDDYFGEAVDFANAATRFVGDAGAYARCKADEVMAQHE